MGMQNVLCIALALLVAGCAAPPADDPGPADDGTSPPDQNDPDIRPTDHERPPGLSPQEHRAQHQGQQYPGIHLQGVVDACEEGFCVEATATNQGAQTVYVHDVCVPPWSESMVHGGEEVQHQETRFYCAAFGTAPMEPGDQLFYNTTWDERLWDGEESSPAPDGPYEWYITFRVFGSEDGGEPEDIQIDFPVIVGEM